MKKFLVFLLLLALAGGTWWWWSRRSTAQAPSFQRYRVERGDLVQAVQATGNVGPLNRLELRPPVAGRVEQVLVHEGDYVKMGQILAWLSSTERAALLDAARAQGPEALARWEGLYKATPLLAPLSGQVIARSTEPGQTVTAADVVLVLSDRLIVKAQVDETDIAKIHSGMGADIRLDAYADKEVPARVGHIAYEARTVNNVTMYDVDVAPERIPSFMRSGMTANVSFVTQRRDHVLLLPLDALQQRRGDEAVVSVVVKAAGGAKNGGKEGAKDAAAEDGARAWKRDGASAGMSGGAKAWNHGGPRNGEAPQTLTRTVSLGLDNGQEIEVTAGLEEGDRVIAVRQGLPSAAGAGSNPFMPQRPGGQARRAAR